MKKKKLWNIVSLNFHSYKMSWTMFLWGLSAVLYVLGNKFGMLCLILAFLPILAWVILVINEKKTTEL